jgi:hypothetical protein
VADTGQSAGDQYDWLAHFAFLIISSFLPAKHGLLAGKLLMIARGYSPRALPFRAKWEPLAPAPKTF